MSGGSISGGSGRHTYRCSNADRSVKHVSRHGYPRQPEGTRLVVLYRPVTGGDQDQIGNFTIKGSGDLVRDVDATVIGPDNATFTATVTRVRGELIAPFGATLDAVRAAEAIAA